MTSRSMGCNPLRNDLRTHTYARGGRRTTTHGAQQSELIAAPCGLYGFAQELADCVKLANVNIVGPHLAQKHGVKPWNVSLLALVL
jgi:hypothetical protein